MPQYVIRFGNSDPDFRDDESWPWPIAGPFDSWEAARVRLAEYFEDLNALDGSCPVCQKRAGEVAPLVRAATPETWDPEQIEVDGEEYWIERETP